MCRFFYSFASEYMNQIMKKLALLLLCVVAAMTSCKNDVFDTENTYVTPKYVDTITRADGSVISLDYDSENRIKSVTWTDALDASRNQHYDVVYNIDNSANTVTYDIISGGDRYTMNFNDRGALKSYEKSGAVPQVLSTFSYHESPSVFGAGRLELVGMVDKVTGGETKTIEWQSGVPSIQINEIRKVEDGVNCDYSTSIRYGYRAYRSNVHANVNLFNLLTPEFLQYSNMTPVLAATMSAFGSRSTYLPTDVSIVNGKMPVGGNYEKLSEVSRVFSYDTDADGYILKIHTGKDDDNTKVLLYTITYRTVTE